MEMEMAYQAMPRAIVLLAYGLSPQVPLPRLSRGEKHRGMLLSPALFSNEQS